MKKSLAEIAQSLDTDKSQSEGYLNNFERHFNHLRDMQLSILELGVFHGGSLLMWHEYFSNGFVVGLDLNPNPLAEMPERIRFYQGSQDDEILLDRIAMECAPDGFDIVIDDASHIGKMARASFRNLFEKHVKRGGIYVVEDWGTGYWSSWPDGQNYYLAEPKYSDASSKKGSLLKRLSRKLGLADQKFAQHLESDPDFAAHNFGMVGFVKELVDEVAWPDITSPDRGNSGLQRRASIIREMTIYTGHAFVVKA